jgi:hypothetical protein
MSGNRIPGFDGFLYTSGSTWVHPYTQTQPSGERLVRHAWSSGNAIVHEQPCDPVLLRNRSLAWHFDPGLTGLTDLTREHKQAGEARECSLHHETRQEGKTRWLRHLY